MSLSKFEACRLSWLEWRANNAKVLLSIPSPASLFSLPTILDHFCVYAAKLNISLLTED